MPSRNLIVLLCLVACSVMVSCINQPVQILTVEPVQQNTRPVVVELPTNTTQPTTTSMPQIPETPDPEKTALLQKKCEGKGRFFNDLWAICDLGSHTFLVFNTQGKEWRFSYEELEYLNIKSDDPEFDTNVIATIENGEYAYLVPIQRGFSSPRPWLGTGVALIQLELKSGWISKILPKTNTDYSISFSPTGKRKVFSKFEKPLQLNLDFHHQTVLTLDGNYDQAGEFVWSDDGLKLAYKLISFTGDCTLKYSIRVLLFDDTESLHMREFLNKSSLTLVDNVESNICQAENPIPRIKAITDASVILETRGKETIITLPSKIQVEETNAVTTFLSSRSGFLETPIPYPADLNSPETSPLWDLLIKSQKIESFLFCNHDSDLNELPIIYRNTPDYIPHHNSEILITKYLGSEAARNAGYLTWITAYHMWHTSGDGFPDSLTEIPPTLRPREFRVCPDVLQEPDLEFKSLDLHDNVATIEYVYGPYTTRAIMRRLDGTWYIVNSTNIAVNN